MASASTISSSYSPFETNSPNLRDDSFSSYLALVRQSFSSELANPSSRRSSFKTTVVPPPKRLSKDNGELDVFDAEKYFSGALDDIQDSSDLISETTMLRSKKTKKSGARTRSSTCSETSTNSHSLLLRDRRPQQQLSPAPRRRSFLDVFRCSCSNKTAVKVEEDADIDSPIKSSSKLPGVSRKTLHRESSPDLFEIDTVPISSLPVYEPSEASIDWSVTTASAANFSSVPERAREGRKVRSSSGLFGFGFVSDNAVRSTVAGAEIERVGSLERYNVMMDLESVSGAGSVAARPRRASLGY